MHAIFAIYQTKYCIIWVLFCEICTSGCMWQGAAAAGDIIAPAAHLVGRNIAQSPVEGEVIPILLMILHFRFPSELYFLASLL